MRRLLRSCLIDLPSLIFGLLVYVITHKTPSCSYQSMIRMFCVTRGRSNDWLSRLVGWIKGSYEIDTPRGVLGNLSESIRGEIITKLRNQGYYIFPQRLPSSVCDRLFQYAITQPCKIRKMDDENLGEFKLITYHREKPLAVRYDFNTQDIINNIDVQKLMADLSLLSVAQEYLASKPVIDVTSMWWHTAYSDKPDREAAQYFHFDMDRPKWLKFFIYLTDVSSVNGPHMFVAGSQKTGAIPSDLLRKGYARLTDIEVLQYFDKNDLKEFIAPRGTIIAEDTRGLHKGKHVDCADRLILQIQFSNILFGATYSKAHFKGDLVSDLQLRIKQFPGLYRAYL